MDEFLESAAKVADLRQRVVAGEEVSPEEFAEAVRLIRMARKAAPEKASRGNATGAAKANAAALLNNFINPQKAG